MSASLTKMASLSFVDLQNGKLRCVSVNRSVFAGEPLKLVVDGLYTYSFVEKVAATVPNVIITKNTEGTKEAAK